MHQPMSMAVHSLFLMVAGTEIISGTVHVRDLANGSIQVATQGNMRRFCALPADQLAGIEVGDQVSVTLRDDRSVSVQKEWGWAKF